MQFRLCGDNVQIGIGRGETLEFEHADEFHKLGTKKKSHYMKLHNKCDLLCYGDETHCTLEAFAEKGTQELRLAEMVSTD